MPLAEYIFKCFCKLFNWGPLSIKEMFKVTSNVVNVCFLANLLKLMVLTECLSTGLEKDEASRDHVFSKHA